MATIYELKELINTMASLVQTLASMAEITADSEAGAKNELALFLMYLSASDGEISWKETSMISNLFDMNFTPQTMSDFIRENNIYSTEFENKAPVAIQLLVMMDNRFIEMGLTDVPDGFDTIIDTYKTVGLALMNADDDIDANEQNDFDIYINMLEEYVNSNSVRRKRSVSGFTKNCGGVTAPTKTGVSAPPKKV